jgi:hypothetical protein
MFVIGQPTIKVGTTRDGRGRVEVLKREASA